MKEAIAIGLMSGSSLDGLDIALVRFQEEDDKYHFQILQAETLPYPEYWTEQLSEAFHKQPEDLIQLDKDYGKYLGEQVLAFAKKHNVTPDFVASHGHTIFHRPEEHYTPRLVASLSSMISAARMSTRADKARRSFPLATNCFSATMRSVSTSVASPTSRIMKKASALPSTYALPTKPSIISPR